MTPSTFENQFSLPTPATPVPFSPGSDLTPGSNLSGGVHSALEGVVYGLAIVAPFWLLLTAFAAWLLLR